MKLRSPTLLSLLIAGSGGAAFAEDLAEVVARGEKIYSRAGMCITCHQADGNGLPGAFPPLAGSDWVKGEPAALIRMIEQGVEGEITVNGKIYSAVMPAQGGQLSNKEIADVLTYVRNSWGNKASAVSVKDVEEQKKIDKDRGEKPWSASELKTMATPKGLEDPTVKSYAGAWIEVPSLAKLPAPASTTPGLLGKATLPKEGGLVVAEGTLKALKNGEAAVTVKSDGPTQVWIDDSLVVSSPLVIGWNGSAVTDRVSTLAVNAGAHRFRIAAVVRPGGVGKVAAAVNLPGYAKPIPLTDGKAEASDRGENGLDLDPAKAGEAMLYRGVFPEVTSNRSIAIGFPERQSMTFDAINNTWTMAWNGGFMTGRHHWVGRGMEFREWPLANRLALLPGEPPLAVLAAADAPWPAKCDIDVWPEGYRFLGYDLDKAKRPTFRYQAAGATVTDRPEPLAKGDGLRRTLVIAAPKAIAGLTFRPIAGKSLEKIDATTFRLDGRLRVTLGLPAGTVATTRPGKDGLTEVLVPVTLAGKDVTITEEYLWEDGK